MERFKSSEPLPLWEVAGEADCDGSGIKVRGLQLECYGFNGMRFQNLLFYILSEANGDKQWNYQNLRTPWNGWD